MKVFKSLLTLTIISFLSSVNLDAASPEPNKRKAAEQKDEQGHGKRARVERCSGCTQEIQQGASTMTTDCCKAIIHNNADCLGKHQMRCADAIAAQGNITSAEAPYADAFNAKRNRTEHQSSVSLSSDSDRKVELKDELKDGRSGLDLKHSVERMDVDEKEEKDHKDEKKQRVADAPENEPKIELDLSSFTIVRDAKDKHDHDGSDRVLSVDEILSKTETTHLKLQNITPKNVSMDDLLKLMIEKFSKLKSIKILGGSEITNKGIRYLSESKSLDEVKINQEYSTITSLGLTYLEKLLPKLKTLSLDSFTNKIGNGFFKALGKSPSLKKLSFTWCELKAVHIKHISQSKSLEEFSVISPSKLTTNHLHINNNTLKDLSQIKTLKSISFFFTHDCLDEEDDEESYFHAFNYEGIQHLGTLPLLESINFRHCLHNLNNDTIKFLSQIKTLKSITLIPYLTTYDVTDQGIQHLVNLPLLKSLHLESIGSMSDQSIIQHFSQIKTLKSLILDLCPKITNKCINTLYTMQSLETLKLGYHDFTRAGKKKVDELISLIKNKSLKNKSYLPTLSLDSGVKKEVQQILVSLTQDAKKLATTNHHLNALQPKPLDEQPLFNNFDFLEFYSQPEKIKIEKMSSHFDFCFKEIPFLLSNKLQITRNSQNNITYCLNSIFDALYEIIDKQCLAIQINANLETMTKMLYQTFLSHFSAYYNFACKNHKLYSDEESPQIEIIQNQLKNYQGILSAFINIQKNQIAKFNHQLAQLTKIRDAKDNKLVKAEQKELITKLAASAPQIMVQTFKFFQKKAQYPKIATILEKTMRGLDNRTLEDLNMNIVEYKALLTDPEVIKNRILHLETSIVSNFIAVFNATLKGINELCESTQKELDLNIIKRRKKGLQALLETKLGIITAYALALCEKDPVAAFKITADIKAILMPIDKEVAQAAHTFIIEALNKFKQEIREALLYSFTFNFAYLDALAAKSLALCSEEKDAINWLAQKSAFTDEKEWEQVATISKKYADKLSERNEALNQEIKDPVKLAALPAKLQKLQNDVKNQTSIDFKIVQGQLLTQQAIVTAEVNLTKLAQNKEQSLQNMLSKAGKIAHEIQNITKQVHPRFVIEAFGSDPEQLNAEMNKRIDKSLGIIKQSLTKIAAQKAAPSAKRKRHSDDQEKKTERIQCKNHFIEIIKYGVEKKLFNQKFLKQYTDHGYEQILKEKIIDEKWLPCENKSHVQLTLEGKQFFLCPICLINFNDLLKLTDISEKLAIIKHENGILAQKDDTTKVHNSMLHNSRYFASYEQAVQNQIIAAADLIMSKNENKAVKLTRCVPHTACSLFDPIINPDLHKTDLKVDVKQLVPDQCFTCYERMVATQTGTPEHPYLFLAPSEEVSKEDIFKDYSDAFTFTIGDIPRLSLKTDLKKATQMINHIPLNRTVNCLCIYGDHGEIGTMFGKDEKYWEEYVINPLVARKFKAHTIFLESCFSASMVKPFTKLLTEGGIIIAGMTIIRAVPMFRWIKELTKKGMINDLKYIEAELPKALLNVKKEWVKMHQEYFPIITPEIIKNLDVTIYQEPIKSSFACSYGIFSQATQKIYIDEAFDQKSLQELDQKKLVTKDKVIYEPLTELSNVGAYHLLTKTGIVLESTNLYNPELYKNIFKR